MSYFAAALARTEDGWVASEIDFADVPDREALAEHLRELSGAGDGPSLLLREWDDE